MQADELLDGASAATEQVCRPLVEMLRGAGTLDSPIAGSRWTVRDTAAHLVSLFDLYGELATGSASPYPTYTPAVVAAENARRLADIGERDPVKLATLLCDSVERFAEITAGQPAGTPVVWHEGIGAYVASLAGVLLGELLLHGLDVATALGRPWSIRPDHAGLTLASYGFCLPYGLDPRNAAGVHATVRLEVDGADPAVLRFADGALTLEAADAPTDAVLAADPVAFLLVLLGRLDRAAAFALGSLRASGPDPALAYRFFDLFATF